MHMEKSMVGHNLAILKGVGAFWDHVYLHVQSPLPNTLLQLISEDLHFNPCMIQAGLNSFTMR